jgi:hypothetical protein
MLRVNCFAAATLSNFRLADNAPGTELGEANYVFAL